jgi:glutathione S-transferase
MSPYEPLRREVDGGAALIESTAILDYLDELVEPDKTIIAAGGGAPARAENVRAGEGARRQGGESSSRARAVRGRVKNVGRAPCGQISGVLDMLEKERAAIATPYWFGAAIDHADIAVASCCGQRFASPDRVDPPPSGETIRSPAPRIARRANQSSGCPAPFAKIFRLTRRANQRH